MNYGSLASSQLAAGRPSRSQDHGFSRSGALFYSYLLPMSDKDSDKSQVQDMWEVTEYCIRVGIDETQQKRLVQLLGRYASRHELQMNVRRHLRPR
ncbi:hypothetical protein DBL06_25810 [Agrobacterium pusense]|nr:hypothetical protein DBL06_25810 [Agrobacterium pusense]TZG36514.1 hypothetical protein AGR1_03170 [Agrobacterium sp. B1(2019)]